jgi:hypothetical protein
MKWFSMLLFIAVPSCLTPQPVAQPAVATRAQQDCPSGAATDVAGQAWDIPMVDLCDGIFAEKGTPEAKQRWIVDMHARALRRVGEFFGGIRAEKPEVFLCSSDDCRQYFTGRTDNARSSFQGRAGERGTITVTSIDASFEGTLAHELTHAELHTRIGGHRVPAWFNEGLATYVSLSPICEGAPLARLEDIVALNESKAWWSETDAPTAESWAIYCRARTEFERWYMHHGSAHFFSLLQGVERGESFDDLYGPLMTED